MTISIVIPTYNHYNLLHQVLWDIYQYNRGVDEVLVVDDGSTEVDYHQGLEWWKEQKFLPLRVLEMEENVGFLKACNAGVKKATGDIVILLSNDVRVQTNIIDRISTQLLNDPSYIIGGRLLKFDTGWNTFDGKMFPYLEGWLIACTKDAWDNLEGFDEQFAPWDYEDIDLSTKAIDKGYLLLALDDPSIMHIGGASIGFTPEREKVTLEHKELFRKKWTK